MLKSYINLKEMFNLIISKYNNNIFNNPIAVFLIYKINIIFIKKICNKICLWRLWLLSQVFFIFKVSIFNNKRSWSNHGLLLLCAQHGQQLDGESPLWAW